MICKENMSGTDCRTDNNEERAYLSLLTKILEKGEERRSCRNGTTLSIFGERLEFHINGGTTFPLLTTKRVFWRGIVEELLWFLRGDTDSKVLSARGVHIWDGNTTREFLDSVGLEDVKEGEIGAGYGYQWRCFGGDYPERKNGIDQLRYVLQQLSENPGGRRAVLCAWNPKQLERMALPPCHFTYVFYLSERDGLSCQMQMRSCDTCAGLPFNIASTALLTCILAAVLHVPAHRIVIVMGDTHIYEQHIENAKVQCMREPGAFPVMQITKDAPAADENIDAKLAWIEQLHFEDFSLENYAPQAALKYEMIA